MEILQRFLQRQRPRYAGIERRRSPRSKVIVTAWVLADNSQRPLVAVLWDVSVRGARLTVADPESLPDRFALLFSRQERPGMPCRIVWRSGQQIGIEFLAAVHPLFIDSLAYRSDRAE